VNTFRVTSPAEADLAGIWRYIAQDRPAAARDVIANIVGKFPVLAAMPRLGRTRDDVGPAIRGFVVSRYVILYRIAAPELIEIMRIVDGSRDLADLLG
jgi:toxin ParE1/3/4